MKILVFLFENSVRFEEPAAAGCEAAGKEEGLLQARRGHGDHTLVDRLQGSGRGGEESQESRQKINQKVVHLRDAHDLFTCLRNCIT